MSNLKETDNCISDTQETYYEGANEGSKEGIIDETQNLSVNESQDFRLIDSEGDDSLTEKKTVQNEKNNHQESIKQSDLQIQDVLRLKMDDKIVTANDKENEVIKNKELENESIKKIEKDSNVFDPEEKKESCKEDIQDIPPPNNLLSSGTSSNIVDPKHQTESFDELSIKISTTIKTISEDIIGDDRKNKSAETQELVENELVGKAEDVSNNVEDSEMKDEFSDEDEIIQGTPPQNYSSKKSIGSVEVTNLKRKNDSFDKLPIKVSKMTSAEDVTNSKKFEDEESHQSYESDDSYQDLFKNREKNIIIEETQDTTNQEFTQNSHKKSSLKHAVDNDKIQEHCFEQINQEENIFSTKCYNVEKDENLNVSTKLTDTKANDSTTVNANSMNESNLYMQDNSLLVEAKKNISMTNITDEKSKADIPDKTDKTDKVLETTIEEGKTNHIENIEKIANKNDEETSIIKTKVYDEAQSNIKNLSRLSSSIELIYDTGCENKSEPEIVEIDEDGEKIILDSSAEVIYDRRNSAVKPEVVEIVDNSHEDGERIVLDSLGEGLEVQAADKNEMYKRYHEGKITSDFSYKSLESMKESSLDSKSATDRKLMNGNSGSKRSDTDVTLSVESDTFSGCNTPIHSAKADSNIAAFNRRKFTKSLYLGSKDVDNTEVISLSDNEISNLEEKNKSDLIHNNALAKTIQMEREIDMYVRFKCTLHMDESTKEFLSKELTAVQCEAITESTLIGKQKNEDSQTSLADISDNKESPGSVNSNPQLYQLNPSRLSIMSSISSSSSASSAASLIAKLNLKNQFSMPLGPAKHAKKHSQDIPSTMSDKQALDESYERLTHEWKNHHLLITTILNCINTELNSSAIITAPIPMDTYVNVSNERLDDHTHHSHHLLEKNSMRSSTPEVSMPSLELISTPKSTKKNKGMKRSRSKSIKSNIAQTNDENNDKNISINVPILHSADEMDSASPNRKKMKIESMPENLSVNTDISANSPPRNALVDDLIGKNVFAKWSDNNYYPGIVNDRVKTKYKVNFYDGKSKMLIPEFVIPIPKILKEGLSVYATTKTNDYGSCGIIIDVQTKPNDENVHYIVETDEGERLRVQVRDIFLSTDQAQVLKEELNSENKSSVPSTPKALGQVTLDNMVDGKRRSKRIGTPIFSTPKSRSNTGTNTSANKAKPSISGISGKLKKEKSALSEHESMSSDSNVELMQMQDEYILRGVQKEIIGTTYQQVKGPQSKIKGKPRSKKKVEDEQIIATLGPIPPANSNIFKGMSFILTCVSLDTLDRYQNSKLLASSSTVSSVETEATETDETENEDEWTELPFARDRLHAQIIAGGGKVYEDFNQIPKDDYKNTKLITNVPNTTAKSILCLSVGIPACNHKWIIRSCLEVS